MKTCPFCGSNDVGYGYPKHPDGRDLVAISCSTCGARGPVRTYANEWDDDEAVSSWNTSHNVLIQGLAAFGASLGATCWALLSE
jgi:Lar family restriction alleviation protein